MLVNFKKRDTSIPLDKFFKIIKPTYVYIKVTPDKSISNYNTTNIAKTIKNTYKEINKRIKIENKKLWVEANFKIAYIIDVRVDRVDFIFMVPDVYQAIIQEKIQELWPKSTLTILECMDKHSKDSEIYQLSYKNEDALSLSVDKRTKEPLNSILATSSIMKDADRVTLIYNFQPRNDFGWQERYNKTMDKLKEFKSISRDKESGAYIFMSALNIILSTLDTVLFSIGSFIGTDMKKARKVSFVETIMSALKDRKDLSIETKRKKDLGVLDCQIAVISESIENDRRINNAMAITQSFRAIDNDNELISKKVKKNIVNIEDYKFKGVDINTVSTDECVNFIQIPSRAMLKTYTQVEQIAANEKIVPEALQKGTKCLGPVKCKGAITNAYLPNEYNAGNYPLVANGGQGSGKTTFLGNYARDCTNAGEGIVLLDYIKNCELSNEIAKVVPKNKLVIIDLGKETDVQGFGYNEININPNATDYEKLKDANIQSQEVMNFIDSISLGEALTGRMRRFLSAASNISFMIGCTSIKDVIRCLEDHTIRLDYINKLTENQKNLLQDEIKNLEELNEWSKVSKKEAGEGVVPEIIGTRESKIEGILDRISLLREDFKLKYMYNSTLDNNINLVECMEAGKVVLIKMPESEFTTKLVKNVLVTYFISKVWLASKERGKLHEKPSRCNLIVDELFQAPTCLETLKYILPQSRKYGCKTVISNHYFNQISEIEEALEGSGASYMIMKGTNKSDFSKFDGKIGDFLFEDLEDMERFSSLNIIFDGDKTHSFISKLPSPLSNNV